MMAREIRKQNKVWISNKEFVLGWSLNICNTSEGIRKSRVNHREFTVIDALHTVCYKLLHTTQPQSMKSEVNPTVLCFGYCPGILKLRAPHCRHQTTNTKLRLSKANKVHVVLQSAAVIQRDVCRDARRAAPPTSRIERNRQPWVIAGCGWHLVLQPRRKQDQVACDWPYRFRSVKGRVRSSRVCEYNWRSIFWNRNVIHSRHL